MNINKCYPTPIQIIINLIGVYVCYGICRAAFLFENWSLFNEDMSWQSITLMFRGGCLFDTSAIFYSNSLYLLLVLLPLHLEEKKSFRRTIKWLFIITNATCIVANLVDCAYFPYSMHRTTAMVFEEFKHESNLGAIFRIELIRHWYLPLLAIVLIVFLAKLYRDMKVNTGSLKMYYIRQGISLLLFIPIAICGMRGAGFVTATRPIAISNAYQYASRPLETAIVLNTPFAILRTLSETPLRTPTYFTNHHTLDRYYSPVHIPTDTIITRKKNVVILIVESFAQEFIGGLNKHLDQGIYQGYTPFTDSLLQHCLYFEDTFSNSGFSIDAMPAVLASIPRMDRPFVLTPFSLNTTTSLASELKNWGYQTAFFHGADNESLGFQAFARSIGFDDYLGKTEYGQDKRFNGDKDFDGTWAIWDEPFLQYFCLKMNEMKEPFLSCVFTATSHHPFAIPEKYKDVFKDEGIHLIHKCIRYTDHSIRHFFNTARQQAWYKNTIFVITADHASSKTTHAEYNTELGHFRIPILIYDPSGEMPVGKRKGIAQQIDIMPTILNYLGYDKPYIAFGKDLLDTPYEEMWAVNWDHIPQFIKGDYLLQFNGTETTAIYAYRTDRLLRHNLKGQIREEESLTNQLKAFIQSYMERMKADSVSLSHKSKIPQN